MSKQFGVNMDIPTTKGDRKLVWGDCFNGSDIDKELWTPMTWDVSDIIHEWSDKTYYVKDGQITLTSTKLPPEKVKDGKVYYTPAFLTTQDKMEFKYGYFEVKAQVPFYVGNSAAFWFISTQKTKDDHGAEIDMVELLGQDDNVVCNLHIWGKGHSSLDGQIHRTGRNHVFESKGDKLRSETHTYFMDWTPDYIDFGVDGEVFFHAPLSAEKGKELFGCDTPDLDAFHLPIFFILSEYLYTPGRNLSWGMSGEEEPFEYVMKVDHVALYQKDGEEIYFK